MHVNDTIIIYIGQETRIMMSYGKIELAIAIAITRTTLNS